MTMVESSEHPDELSGFGADARRVVALAESEARALRHPRVGTEHLLLGVLALDGSVAADRLAAAGVTLTATRHKVAQAVAAVEAIGAGALGRSERAARALGRSHRFSHASRSATVGPEHVLLGVLDVEGLAGQVLRGLGADVDRLTAILKAPPLEIVSDELSLGDAERDSIASGEDLDQPPVAPATAITVSCPGCASSLEDAIDYRVLIAAGPRGPREVVAYACGTCGRALGIAPS